MRDPTVVPRPGGIAATGVRSTPPASRDIDVDAVGDAAARELAGNLRGALLLPGDRGYDEERRVHNRLVSQHPAVLVAAAGAADIMVAVAFASRHELPVGALNTGHGVTTSSESGVVVSTRRMRGVHVDPHTQTAHVEAGARWGDVVHEAAAFGLAPLAGSSPDVGVVGYLLGGGLPLLGRTFGQAADRVRRIDIVTRHGVLRQAAPDQLADLFWALRGGKGNFGIVTAMVIELVSATEVYGGGLFFPGRAAPEVLTAYRRWVPTVPETTNSSIGLVRVPWHADAPAELRGRFVVHLRLAHVGGAAEGIDLAAPLRRSAPLLRDTVHPRGSTDLAAIHEEPSEPAALHEYAAFLDGLNEELVDELLNLAGPDSACPLRLVEIRHLGGALARETGPPSAVVDRDAPFQLYAVGEATGGGGDAPDVVAAHLDAVRQRTAPWHRGTGHPNFVGRVDSGDLDRVYGPTRYRSLARVKRAYDPDNLFRLTTAIPPNVGAGASRGR